MKNVQEGDKVLLSFAFCNACRACKRGLPSACKDWIGKSTFSQSGTVLTDEHTAGLNFGRGRANGKDTSASANGKRIHGTFFGQSALAKHACMLCECRLSEEGAVDPLAVG